ncbi:glycosyltransferase [Hymenobacter sp.]|jgi:hypothetical protein|uniref:glycosyltransferase n=1 Tax=Hymenobacter sp. TaxID=1898978 RepID=UPI002ED7EA28
MISIIICSRDKEALRSVSQSLAATIGVPYEIIAIDNSKGRYTIFQAYNVGIEKSKFNILCFMHEDISFETYMWGEKVIESFKSNKNLGLLGVAGSSYKPVVPSGWSFDSACSQTTYMNIVQHYKAGNTQNKIYNNPRNESLSQVVAVDGVWFCTTRSVVAQFKFDDIYFSGFHCYDVDFSLTVLQKYEVAVTFDILINHFSEGSFNDSWITETIKLHEKWRKILPVNLEGLLANEQAREEFKAFHAILPRLIGKQALCKDVSKQIWKNNVQALVGIKKFIIMNLLLVKKTFEVVRS